MLKFAKKIERFRVHDCFVLETLRLEGQINAIKVLNMTLFCLWLQSSRSTLRTFLTTWRRRSSGRGSFSLITSTGIGSMRASRTSSQSVPNRTRRVPYESWCSFEILYTLKGLLTSSERVKWLRIVFWWSLFTFPGQKTMVNQGVKNPMVDLLSLEDKTLDEVSGVRL